jgi:hypothetical protein
MIGAFSLCIQKRISGVTPEWARDAGDGYAKALLGACDKIRAGA